MKAITRIFAIACMVAIVGALAGSMNKGVASTTSTNKQIGLTFLDLTVDPCSPTPMTTSQKNTLISLGYKDSILAVDAYFEGVQFKSMTSGYYSRDGWVHAGTEFLYNPIDPNKGGTFAVCENVYTYWRWQV